MAGDIYKCGPTASEERNKTSKYRRNNNEIDVYSCEVTGTGTITSTYASSSNWYDYRITIKEGITGLADKCYSKESVTFISLPDTLVSIGNECFRNSNILNLTLPDGLTHIGENNFPNTLQSINIPPLLTDFPLNNIFNCSSMLKIEVHPDNPTYCSHDGLLYTKDRKTLLFCPRSRTDAVIVPEGVTTLGSRCFQGCKKLARIHLPSTLRRIEDWALAESVHSTLKIPNSVDTVGARAFSGIKVTSVFRFSKQVKYLPNYCFYEAHLCDYSFIKQIRSIGAYCFQAPYSDNVEMPKHLQLLELEELGEKSFYNRKEIESLEFSSRLKKIHKAAFYNMNTFLQIRIHSLIPYHPGTDVFDLGYSTKLIVPEGTADIFRHTPPWLAFPTIDEMKTEVDSTEGKVIEDTKLLGQRLESIALSCRLADRPYLAGLLQNLMMDWTEMDSEDDYRKAVNLSNYNRMFNPPLVPDLERNMAALWPDRYKYMFLAEIMKYPVAPLAITQQVNVGKAFQLDVQQLGQLPDQSQAVGITYPESVVIPLPSDCQPETEVHFDRLLQILTEELNTAESSIEVAVSWFTNHALYRLLGELADKGVQIRVVINNDSVNNGGYCLDFDRLLQKGVRMSLVEYPHMIHHKFCIIDGQTVVNGSYNWTRFSAKNYENLTIFRNQPDIVKSFADEFARLWQGAEHKDINRMPDAVPDLPEYDRQAFRQYVTEELDAQARSVSDRRECITALHRAVTLNPAYLDTIHPTARTEYADALQVADQAKVIKTEVADMIQQHTPTPSPAPSSATTTTGSQPGQASTPSAASPAQADKEASVQKVMASQLYMALDVSGSMSDTYKKGHVKHLGRQAVAAALAVSESEEVSLWQFGDDSRFIAHVGIQNLDVIDKVCCMNENTCLLKFVQKATDSMAAGSLVIIFTDDDGTSLKAALPSMEAKADCFWQIIACEQQCTHIQPLVTDISNVSLVNCFGYGSKTETELHTMLLHDYIHWKSVNLPS